MADQGLFQSRQHRQALLTQRREIAADAAEGHSESLRAETAGDLLLDLHHADIALREAVVKRHRKVVQEQQHGILVLGEAIEQIARRRLFAPTFPARRWGRIGRVGLIAFGKPGAIASFPVSQLQRMQTTAALCSCLLDRSFALQEQFFHLGCPGLPLLFLQEGQVAQMMHITAGMLAPKLPIRSRAIMHAHPAEVCQDADGIQGRFAPFGMDRIVGQVLCRDSHATSGVCLPHTGWFHPDAGPPPD
jgi:hypothetical protein